MSASLTRRLLVVLALSLAGGTGFVVQADAAWSLGGSGPASALANTMPNGSQPTASLSRTSVTVQWTPATFSDGASVAGYVVRRYDAASGTLASITAGCTGVVATTTCTESAVPAGTWMYTVAPVQDNWSGGEGPASAGVTVP
jgi:hypothetical protein